MKKIVMVLPEDVRDNMEIQGQVVEVEASANTDTVRQLRLLMLLLQAVRLQASW